MWPHGTAKMARVPKQSSGTAQVGLPPNVMRDRTLRPQSHYRKNGATAGDCLGVAQHIHDNERPSGKTQRQAELRKTLQKCCILAAFLMLNRIPEHFLLFSCQIWVNLCFVGVHTAFTTDISLFFWIRSWYCEVCYQQQTLRRRVVWPKEDTTLPEMLSWCPRLSV